MAKGCVGVSRRVIYVFECPTPPNMLTSHVNLGTTSLHSAYSPGVGLRLALRMVVLPTSVSGAKGISRMPDNDGVLAHQPRRLRAGYTNNI